MNLPPGRRDLTLPLALAAAAWLHATPVGAGAAEAAVVGPPRPGADVDATVDPTALSGKDIYERVVENRLEAYEQKARLVSGDRAGNEQESRMDVLWKSFRDESDRPTRGVLSKTVIRYTHPFELRFSGYLIIDNLNRPDDQFVYLASRRRVRRVNLRGEAVLGTDFSFEDVLPRETEEADYLRLPDEEVEGVDCYVVDVVPRAESNSEYSRFRVWVEQQRYVVLRAVYWDRSDVEVKRLSTRPDAFELFEGVWIPLRSEMRNVQLDSYTELHIDELTPNPEIPNGQFDPRRLESH